MHRLFAGVFRLAFRAASRRNNRDRQQLHPASAADLKVNVAVDVTWH